MSKDYKSLFPDSSSRKFSKNHAKPEALPESTPLEKGLDGVLQKQLNDKLKAAPSAVEEVSGNSLGAIASDAQDLEMDPSGRSVTHPWFPSPTLPGWREI
ncbi:hypothetical protein CCP4SC76_3480007 [Gammaproteobacteria bacterium]